MELTKELFQNKGKNTEKRTTSERSRDDVLVSGERTVGVVEVDGRMDGLIWTKSLRVLKVGNGFSERKKIVELP